MKEVMMEDQTGEAATAAAATAVELPNSTASAMETGRDREGPQLGSTSCTSRSRPETSGASDEGHGPWRPRMGI